MTELFLGIDSGSSGCRGYVIDGSGEPLAQAYVELPGAEKDGVKAEFDPSLWCQGVQAVFDKLSQLIDLSKVISIAIDATSGTVLLVDSNGRAVTPALMYNDTQASHIAEKIDAHIPANSAAGGKTSAVAKMLYLTENNQNSRIAHHADWLVGYLTGKWGITDENNALKLGYDPQERQWPSWLLKITPNPQTLPQVLEPGDPIGPVLTKWQKKYGFSPQATVVAGTTDSIAATIAAGVKKIGEGVTSLGSTLVLKMCLNKPIFSKPHGIYSHRLGNLWLAGGASNSGGAVLTKFFRREQLQKLSDKINPQHPLNLNYYPLLRPGERFPISDPNWPVKMEPRPVEDELFLQGLLEGMAEIERQGYQLLQSMSNTKLTRVYTAGGGAHNLKWQTLRQNRLQIPVVPAEMEQAAYGAALLAMRGIKKSPTISGDFI